MAKLTALVVLFILAAANLFAQTDTTLAKTKTQKELEDLLNSVTQTKSVVVENEIANIVIDQTKTKHGKDFIDQFNTYLDLDDSTTPYTIIVEERPNAGRSSMIIVTVNDLEIYSNNIQPREDLLMESSLEAAEIVGDFIRNYSSIMREMSNKEQLGTGIF
jgi:NAD-dependent DNA ligase